MEHRTCPTCGNQFTCPRGNQRFCNKRCSKAWHNRTYRATTEQAECKHCTKTFDRTRGRSQHVYCSDNCHYQAKRDRFATPQHETWLAEALKEPARTPASYRQALRNDPCAYCGTAPSGGIDHIEPTSRGGLNDWTNFTGCCKRCNELKNTLPLLLALPWIPLAEEYHRQRRALFAKA